MEGACGAVALLLSLALAQLSCPACPALCDVDGRHDSISRDGLFERLLPGGITLLDVRSTEEYALGHLPGALNIPANELERRMSEIPRGAEVVAYCRGPYCVLSTTAAALLKTKGFRVRRLAAGFPDWKAAGLSVEA